MTSEEEQNQRYADGLRRWRNFRIESAQARAEEDEQALSDEPASADQDTIF